jgi:hypothetical protein
LKIFTKKIGSVNIQAGVVILRRIGGAAVFQNDAF